MQLDHLTVNAGGIIVVGLFLFILYKTVSSLVQFFATVVGLVVVAGVAMQIFPEAGSKMMHIALDVVHKVGIEAPKMPQIPQIPQFPQGQPAGSPAGSPAPSPAPTPKKP